MATAILSPSSALLTPEQAAGILGVTAGTLNVWRATRRYPLPFVKIGRKVMYRTDDLERFVASRTVGGDSE
jgi:excisionase family DNA binding protein